MPVEVKQIDVASLERTLSRAHDSVCYSLDEHTDTLDAPADRGSRLRQALPQLREELTLLLDVFVAREPMVRGSVYELRRKCGKPTCRCAGATELHSCMVISWTAKGRKRLRTIPDEQRAELVALTERSQRFRKARTRLLEVHAEMLTIIDELEAARRKEP